MVWIPGGGNVEGTASQELFDGQSLARHGVVLVSLNYRLGALGFFAHPDLTRESPHRASGNQGILDQIAGLRWVHDNIGKFGGDPANVTIFGESAGSLDVGVLMTSPLTKGLFRRVIAESGAVVGLGSAATLHSAEERGSAFPSKLGIPSASLGDLRAVSAEQIIQAQSGFDPNDPRSLEIVVDGYVFPDDPAHVFAAGREHRVGLIVGSNARERVLTLPPDLRKAIEQAYGPLAARSLTLYGVGGPESATPDPFYGTPAEQWGTDTTFRCSAVAQLAWHAAAGNPAFEYEFARVPQEREAFGATHAAELSYVFGTLEKAGIRGFGPPARVTAVDIQVSEVMREYWTNFAKTGNPNDGHLPTWPQFDVSSRAYVQFTDAGPIAKQGLRRPFCDLFIENVKRLMAP
jgi:para-nitrobenzyl esterase